jgi:hypothetical protein
MNRLRRLAASTTGVGNAASPADPSRAENARFGMTLRREFETLRLCGEPSLTLPNGRC